MADVHANGARFNVLRMGTGRLVVVFIHGLLFDNHASFYMTLAPAVARQASVLLYDLRGHGLSERTPSGYTGDELVADLHGILAGLGLHDRPLVIVGHSFGGYVALRYAALHGEHVHGVVSLEGLSGVLPFTESMGATLKLEGDARDRKIRELFSDWLANRADADEGESTEVPWDELELDRDRQDTLKRAQRLMSRRRSAVVQNARRLYEDTTFMHDVIRTPPMSEASLACIRCPLLALYGERSDLRPDAERLARLVPQTRLTFVPGQAHGILFQVTAEVRALLLSWLAERVTEGALQ